MFAPIEQATMMMPDWLVQKVVDILLSEFEEENADEEVDLRGRKYANYAMVSRDFFHAYLHFLSRLPAMEYNCDLGCVKFSNRLHRKPAYTAASSVVRLLAAHGKLGGLKMVELGLTSERCEKVVNYHGSSTECLLRLIGVPGEGDKEGPQLEQQMGGIHQSSGHAMLLLNRATIVLRRPSSTPIYPLLGLNSAVHKIVILENDSLFGPPQLHLIPAFDSTSNGATTASSCHPTTPLFDRVSSVHILSWISLESVAAPDGERPTEEEGQGNGHAVPPKFPSLEWIAVISQLLAVCPALREICLEFWVDSLPIKKEGEVEQLLEQLSGAIDAASEEVLNGEPAIKMARPAIEICFKLLRKRKDLPSTHPLFELGRPKRTQRNKDDGDDDDGFSSFLTLNIARELILVESQSLVGRKTVSLETFDNQIDNCCTVT